MDLGQRENNEVQSAYSDEVLTKASLYEKIRYFDRMVSPNGDETSLELADTGLTDFIEAHAVEIEDLEILF